MSTRQFAKISIYIDRDEDWQALPTDAQWLYEHLLHQPNLSTAGVLPIQVEKWAKGSADMTEERVKAALNTLVERRFIVVDRGADELLIRTFIRHDVVPQGSPKVMKGALNCALRTESAKLRGVLLSEIRKLDRPQPDDMLALVDELEARLLKGYRKPIESQSEALVSVPVQGAVQVAHNNEHATCRLCEKPGVREYDDIFCKEHGDEAATRELS